MPSGERLAVRREGRKGEDDRKGVKGRKSVKGGKRGQ